MKGLTPLTELEKELFKKVFNRDYNGAEDDFFYKNEISFIRITSAFYEKKIKWAIELARVKVSTDSKSFAGFMGQHFYNYTPDEIMQKLSE